MNIKEYVPFEQSLEMKQLGFNEDAFGYLAIEGTSVQLPLYQQAFRFFREKYEFTYSIGKTNTAVVHYLGTTQLLQNNESYEAAELATIKWFIDVAKQQ